jgi:hypothetical protein
MARVLYRKASVLVYYIQITENFGNWMDSKMDSLNFLSLCLSSSPSAMLGGLLNVLHFQLTWSHFSKEDGTKVEAV